MVDKDQTSSARVNESTLEVTPAKSSNQRGGNESHEEQDLDVPAVLELHHGVLRQITNISNTGPPAGLEHHPADV